MYFLEKERAVVERLLIRFRWNYRSPVKKNQLDSKLQRSSVIEGMRKLTRSLPKTWKHNELPPPQKKTANKLSERVFQRFSGPPTRTASRWKLGKFLFFFLSLWQQKKIFFWLGRLQWWNGWNMIGYNVVNCNAKTNDVGPELIIQIVSC